MEYSRRFKCDDIRTMFILLIFMTLNFVAVVKSSTVVVDSPYGKIQGVKKVDEKTGQSYLSFQGIPYAVPPVGDLRFTKPQPHPHLDGVFDASNDVNVACPHPDMMTFGETSFTEDCLILNIRTKDTSPPNSSLRKVLVYIHGGGFMAGTSSFYNMSSFVISQDVIVVTINYRLGILGFLSTENEASPGNYGLWDQALAIKWVKDNIRAFGGDPEDIAIAGVSAGAISIGFHVISPHTKGLFTKAYAQSGTASAVSALAVNAQSRAIEIAKFVGCWDKELNTKLGVQESKDLIDCMKKTSLSTITAYSNYGMHETHFVPVVDGDFIADKTAKLLRDEDYLDSVGFFDRSYLIGVNNNEVDTIKGYLQMGKYAIFMNNLTSAEEKEMMWQGYKAQTQKFFIDQRVGETGASDETVVNKIKDFYNRRYTDEDIVPQLVTDLTFLIPSLDFLAAASKRTSCNAYFHHFDYFPQFMKGSIRGSVHGVEGCYWFDTSDSSLVSVERLLNAGIQGGFTEEDWELWNIFSSIIGDFVKTGNPGVTLKKTFPTGWPKYDMDNSYYMNINLNPWVSNFLEKDKQDLWLKTVPSLLNKPHVHSEL